MEILLLIILAVIIIKLFASIYVSNTKGYVSNAKGAIGEGIVYAILQRLQSQDYIVINDIIIKNKSRSSQIDHVVICHSGIIVLETKYYKGWIFGSEESENWMQVLYQDKFNFYNPIMQNRGHINVLKYNLSKYPNIPYFSIIVLAGSCEFKTFDKVETPVVYPGDLYETIMNLSGRRVLTQNEITNIYNIISGISCNDRETKKEHVLNARIKKTEAYNVKQTGRCPRCGGLLVERKGRYGRFLGCKNYPGCKFTTGLSS